MWRDFEAKCPRILGALLYAVSHGLKTLPNVKLDSLPRMADFAVWVTACEGALWKPGTFMAAYTTNIQEAVEVVLDADQVATELRSYMDLHTEFKGSASDLLKALNGITPDAQQKDKGWPKRSNTLSGILRRIAPPLRKIGIDITFARDKRQNDQHHPTRQDRENIVTIVTIVAFQEYQWLRRDRGSSPDRQRWPRDRPR